MIFIVVLNFVNIESFVWKIEKLSHTFTPSKVYDPIRINVFGFVILYTDEARD